MTEQYKVVRGNVLVDKERISQHFQDGHVEKNFRIINNSAKVVLVCNTDGSIIHLRPSKYRTNKHSIIIVHKTYAHNGEVEWLDLSEDPEMRRVQQSCIYDSVIEWEEEISISELEDQKTGIYVNSCDVVLTLNLYAARQLHHQRCKQKIHNDYLQATATIDADAMMNITIRLVDNNGDMGFIYTVFHGKVQRLIPIADPLQDDGVYISGFVDIDAVGNRTIRKDEYYSYADIQAGKCPIRLYGSIREANMEKDSRILKELEVVEQAAKREHEQKMAEAKREFELRQLEKEKELKELERQLKERDAVLTEMRNIRDNEYHAQKHYRNMENERTQIDINEYKYRQENLSNNNKMFTEVIKTVGIVASAVVAGKVLFG